MALVITLVASATAVQAWDRSRPRAVVLHPTEIVAAPGSPPIVILPEGTTVRVLERDGETWRVRAPGRPAGWVAAERMLALDSLR